MSAIEETIAAIQSKVLDLEKDLAGLKGASYGKLKSEIESLNDRVAELISKSATKHPPAAKKDDPDPAPDTDPVASLLDGV